MEDPKLMIEPVVNLAGRIEHNRKIVQENVVMKKKQTRNVTFSDRAIKELLHNASTVYVQINAECHRKAVAKCTTKNSNVNWDWKIHKDRSESAQKCSDKIHSATSRISQRMPF